MIAPARRAALEVLGEVAGGSRDLGEALEFARRGIDDPRDVALLHGLAVGTVRWQSRLDAALAQLSRVPLGKLDREVLLALRLGAFQLLFLTRVPPSAVVHDSVALVHAARKSSAAGLVNAVLRRLAAGEGRGLPVRPAASVATRPAEWVEYLAVVHAHPPWLVARWLAREPLEVVEAWLLFNNTAPPPTLRANPLAGSPGRLATVLAADGITTEPARYAPWGLRVTEGVVATSRAVADGDCVIQDEGSQLAGHLAPVAPGDRVLDVCAAPGGKALIYATAAGAGLLVACDVRAARVRLLADTLRRGRAARAQTVHLDPGAALPFTASSFDVVVVDAPCSGLGTLRRDPDIKWRRGPGDLAGYAARQLDLLCRAAAMVRAGGRLVYTTCSTEPEENEEVVALARRALPGFLAPVPPGPSSAAGRFVASDGYFRTHPARDGLEGYFGAVFERGSGALAPVNPM